MEIHISAPGSARRANYKKNICYVALIFHATVHYLSINRPGVAGAVLQTPLLVID